MIDLDTLQDDKFTVWQPNSVDLLKGENEKDDRWRIGGFASTEDLDRQGESVLQRGLDFGEFVQFGYYNDNHQQHTSAVVGVPELAEFKKGKGWWTEGYLLKGVQRATEIYDLAKSLAAEALAGGDAVRKLGFSIEGKILERSGNKIVRALIRNVALTNSPVNVECTWGLLSKSFATDIECKALSVGHARVASEGGRVLVPEDVEKDEVKYIYQCPRCKKSFCSTIGLEDHIDKSHYSAPLSNGETIIRRAAKSFSRDEAINHLQKLRPEYGREIAARLVDYVIAQQE